MANLSILSHFFGIVQKKALKKDIETANNFVNEVINQGFDINEINVYPCLEGGVYISILSSDLSINPIEVKLDNEFLKFGMKPSGKLAFITWSKIAQMVIVDLDFSIDYEYSDIVTTQGQIL